MVGGPAKEAAQRGHEEVGAGARVVLREAPREVVVSAWGGRKCVFAVAPLQAKVT